MLQLYSCIDETYMKIKPTQLQKKRKKCKKENTQNTHTDNTYNTHTSGTYIVSANITIHHTVLKLESLGYIEVAESMDLASVSLM